MGTTISAIAAMLVLVAFSTTATAQTPPEVTLTRFDCGGGAVPVDIAAFSDTHAYDGRKQQLTVSCYLVKHGTDYLIWDTGYPAAGASGAASSGPKARVSLVEQLGQLGVKVEQIKYVGISHYHGDHTGQAGSFPQATLLIGKGDWDVLTSTPPPGANLAPMTPWISGGSKVDVVPRDKDVFGDGTVTLLDMPGHTPGHHSLLVRLKEKGNVLLTGDLAHFRENYDTNGVPSFNTNRADTLASLDRFKQMARNLNATVIIQHEPRDIDKLPPFPSAAK